jgi:hypothetical protein
LLWTLVTWRIYHLITTDEYWGRRANAILQWKRTRRPSKNSSTVWHRSGRHCSSPSQATTRRRRIKVGSTPSIVVLFIVERKLKRILHKCSGNPNFDMMRQHVLRDPRLLQQLANVSTATVWKYFLLFMQEKVLLTFEYRQIQTLPRQLWTIRKDSIWWYSK